MAQANPPAPPSLLTGEESPRHIPETDEAQNLLFKLMTSAMSGSLYRDPVAMYRWLFDEFLRLMIRAREVLSFRECSLATAPLSQTLERYFGKLSWIADVRVLLPEVLDNWNPEARPQLAATPSIDQPVHEALFLPSPAASSPLTSLAPSRAATPAPVVSKKSKDVGQIRRPLVVSEALFVQLEERGLVERDAPIEIESSSDGEDGSLYVPEEDELQDDEEEIAPAEEEVEQFVPDPVPVVATRARTRSATRKTRTRQIVEVVLPLRSSDRLKKTQEAKTSAKKAVKSTKAKGKRKKKTAVTQDEDELVKTIGRPRKTTVDTVGWKYVPIKGEIVDGRRVVPLHETEKASKHWRALPSETIHWRAVQVEDMCNYCRGSPTAGICLAVDGSGSCKLCHFSHKTCKGVSASVLGLDYTAQEEEDTKYFLSRVEGSAPEATASSAPVLPKAAPVDFGMQTSVVDDAPVADDDLLPIMTGEDVDMADLFSEIMPASASVVASLSIVDVGAQSFAHDDAPLPALAPSPPAPVVSTVVTEIGVNCPEDSFYLPSELPAPNPKRLRFYAQRCQISQAYNDLAKQKAEIEASQRRMKRMLDSYTRMADEDHEEATAGPGEKA